jgi:DNA processing protein
MEGIMNNLPAWLRLQLTPGLGRMALTSLINYFQTPEDTLAAINRGWPELPGLRPDKAREVPSENAPRVITALKKLHDMDARVTTLWDDSYPNILHHLPDPPALLYVCGELPSEFPAIGIVGARRPNHVGRVFAEQISEKLAHAGVTTISGLARGIDTAAHKGTLAGGGKTIAVLGCGIDRIYPSENKELFWQITKQGAIISEYPPGTEPLPGHFPGRNRIISGLSKAVLVVEAAEKSGSLITAEFALEQGKEVMAVPGGIDRKTSYGTNLLIKQGAHPVTNVAEILEILGHTPPTEALTERHTPEGTSLDKPASNVLAFLDLTPRHSDELARHSGLTAIELSAILLQLELQGLAEKLPGGRFIRSNQHYKFP